MIKCLKPSPRFSPQRMMMLEVSICDLQGDNPRNYGKSEVTHELF